ncbi:hypothetical protein D9758_009350 [Tetrapyrgos nigripes]|uniref:Uncharacterized protein n=1 Tax=Tetrapyrgos nigripes TaxID=182062 RepID=A0A8H5GHC8_9AGAR|nr:hypothetical protein D9758_009350 [Tetrapyrgos nigripes]
MSSVLSKLNIAHASYIVAAVTLGLSLLGNLFALVYQSDIIFGLTAHKYTYIEGDHPRHLPLTVGPANMVFKSNLGHFGLGNDPVTWAEWSTMRPREAGYVYLGQTHLPIDVSMWHQVHCLSHIRSLISKGDDGSEHTEHCFHYLRQGILCNADPTLEPRSRQSFDLNGKEIFPGDEVTHTCKDFQYIYEWTMKHREGWSQEEVDRFLSVGQMKHHGGGNGTMEHGGMHGGMHGGGMHGGM